MRLSTLHVPQGRRTISPFSTAAYAKELAMHGTASSAVWSANLAEYVLFRISEPMVVSQFGWENGNAVNGNTDVGVYNEAGTTKLVSTGSTANSGTSAMQAVNVTDVTLDPGRYWLALACDSSTQQFRRLSVTVQILDGYGIKQQVGAWSSGLPSSISFDAAATLGSVPAFCFTSEAVL